MLRDEASHSAAASPARLPLTANLGLECNLQLLTPVTAEVASGGLCDLARHVLAQELATGPWSIVIVITSDDHIQTLHRDFMQIDSPTDVMTFPYENENGGDIVISFDRAAAQAGEFGNTAAEEVAFLVAHGVLHLLGWDDVTPAARDAMLQRQGELIASFNSVGTP